MADPGANSNPEFPVGSIEEAEALIREWCFAAPAGQPPRIGAEAELIPVARASGARLPLDAPLHSTPSVLGLLRLAARHFGWIEYASIDGIPRFATPHSGVISLEPGGQIEYSSGTFTSASAMLRDVRSVIGAIGETAERSGVDLLFVGIDPLNSVHEAPLVLNTPRYVTMAEYLAGYGAAGAIMMRQSAAFQINLDVPGGTTSAWDTANALAPCLAAMFANSPNYIGAESGYASFRSANWRAVDSSRTGLPSGGAEPWEDYAAFALNAVAIRPGRLRRRFQELVSEASVTQRELAEHLTTLFPEVRPRRYLELRSMDALPPDWMPAAVAMASGVLCDPVARAEAGGLLGKPDPGMLNCAAYGLRDRRLRSISAELVGIALRGCSRLGDTWLGADDREAAEALLRHNTMAGRCPADAWRQPAQ